MSDKHIIAQPTKLHETTKADWTPHWDTLSLHHELPLFFPQDHPNNIQKKIVRNVRVCTCMTRHDKDLRPTHRTGSSSNSTSQRPSHSTSLHHSAENNACHHCPSSPTNCLARSLEAEAPRHCDGKDLQGRPMESRSPNKQLKNIMETYKKYCRSLGPWTGARLILWLLRVCKRFQLATQHRFIAWHGGQDKLTVLAQERAAILFLPNSAQPNPKRASNGPGRDKST